MNSEVPDLRLEVAHGLATLTFDRPDSKVNLLTRRVMLRLDGLLEEIQEGIAAGEVRALLVRSGKPDNFIAGADLDQLGARLPHDVRDAEPAANLDQLGPGDDDPPPFCQRPQRQHDGGSVVVDDEGGFGPGQSFDQVLSVRVPGAAFAAAQVVLQV